RTETDLDDFIIHLLSSTKRILIVVLALYAGSYVLDMDPSVRELIDAGAILAFLLQASLWGNQIITFLTRRVAETRVGADDPTVTTIATLMGTVARIVFYTMVALVALDTVGFDVTALITGVGIGGIAIAMAVQGILSDLFGSLTIALDKPFAVGEFITVGQDSGTVEHVGLKSTRVRSVTGEELVMSNGDLLSSRVRNFGRMQERRGNLNLGVTYDTAAEKLEMIPGIIKEIVDEEALARFDRAHFASYGDFSLNFASVYWVETPAYIDFMNTTQSINLKIKRRFEKEGIEMAFPTQTIYVEKDES
ncbi:MAG: mechanosensitive ion channel family protein, partial [Acidobacteriota bacterium]